jgi:hypothetical protein
VLSVKYKLSIESHYFRNNEGKHIRIKPHKKAGCWWLIPVILATWKAEIGRITVQGYLGQ